MSMIRRFDRNLAGRDFVVGDVHGCFDVLRACMAKASFDESRDRLFSVGDLVDRGPSSEEAVDWIARPWFHAVRGNHEQMAIGVAEGRHDHNNYLRNGGGWFLALDAYRQQLIGQAFDTLPVAMEIDHAVGRVGIVHADIWGGSWDAFIAHLENAQSKTRLRNLIEVALWSRSRIQAYQAGEPTGDVVDLFALVVGHTPVKRPVAVGNVAYIDTGAVFGNVLTMLDLAEIVGSSAMEAA